MDKPLANAFASHWLLDPEVVFLNHGSFGATPRVVLEKQQDLRETVESEPVRYFLESYWEKLDAARTGLARFIGARSEDLVFVTNATTGVNTVLNSLHFESGDELLVTNHEYNACRNALDAVASETQAKVVVVELPFPLFAENELVESILAGLTTKTKLLLIDHVTSQTGLVFPLKRLIGELHNHSIEVLVDGAHAPGMIDLDLESLGATYYTGNCHKWVCAPKGAAFLYVSPERQSSIRPLVISHGANAPSASRSRFHLEHDWTGTRDPSAWLSVPAAIQAMGSMLPGGWDELRDRNRGLVLAARQLLCKELDIELPCPDSMIGSMATIPLPAEERSAPADPFGIDPLQEKLFRNFGIEAPVFKWPAPPHRFIRISAQLYNDLSQYEYLAEALKKLVV